jgi:hypothetical protein
MASTDDFNSTLIELAQQLAIVCPRSFIAMNISTMEDLIKRYPTKIISLFVLKVLKYRKKVEEGDEEFFLNANFSDEADGDDAILKKVFEFKNIWRQLSKDNREIVRQYVIQLFDYAYEYLEVISAESSHSM